MPGTPFSPMVGSLVGVNLLFTDEVGVPTDPTTVTVQVRKPDGTQAVLTSTNIGVGIFRAEFLVDRPGQWTVQAKGEGALIVVDEVSFTVRRKAVQS